MTGLFGWLNENNGTVTAMAAVAGVIIPAVYAFFTVLLWGDEGATVSVKYPRP